MNKINEAIEKLRIRDPKLVFTLNPEQSSIVTLLGRLSEPVEVAELRKTPFIYARRFIRDNKVLLGNINEKIELGDERVMTDRRGKTHVIFHQKHGSIPILGGGLSVHYAADGAIYLIKSNLAFSIDLPSKPKIELARAAEIAKKHAGRNAVLFEKMKPTLLVADAKTLHLENDVKRYYLCWQMRIVPSKDSNVQDWIYLVDALDGKVLLRFSAIQTIGTGYYSQGSNLNSTYTGTTYRLQDTVTSSTWPVAPRPTIHTYDDACSTNLGLRNYSEDPDDNWDNGGVAPANRCDDQRAEADVHRFLGYVLNYYYLTHGYNSWNGAGADVRGHAHNMYLPGNIMPNNAFWDTGTQEMYFGDGDNATRDFYTMLDVVGHEFTHAVNTSFNILQTYDGETGALNEAISDLFASFIVLDYPGDDPWPWQQLRQNRLDGTVGRNMEDPSRDAAGVVQYDATNNATKENSCRNGFYPDHYSIRYTGNNDYHGVHWNSLIVSHAFYLMMNGGTHRLADSTGRNITVTGIGVAPIEQMLFEAISIGLLTNNSDFDDFRLVFIIACQVLFPDNLEYLDTVKTAFYAVGIGPDLYIRDTLYDQGEEPGTLSCMSPDIIVRQKKANLITLMQIADINNASLGQDIELGPSNHYVYFRLFNRGFAPASGTFYLFIAPVSAFASPSTWYEVGRYYFPDIAENGGVWVPTTANDCITLPATLINSLGVGHYCFIGIIKSNADPAPNHMLISNISEFHAFISESNNYAWRNCDIVNLLRDIYGIIPKTERSFQINGFGRLPETRYLEIDTRDLPEGTKVVLLIPETRVIGLKVFEVRIVPERIGVQKIAGVLEELSVAQLQALQVPLSGLLGGGRGREWCHLSIPPGKVFRVGGIDIKGNEKIKIRFMVEFPRDTGIRDVTLAFRELYENRRLGQMSYIFRIRRKHAVW